jgi:molybdate transport system substrate-binding protein
VLLLAALLVAQVHAQGPAPAGELTVFAAASLTEAFRELAGTTVRFNFAGSQQLALQIEQGARADVFASADQRWMDYARERNLIEGESRVFVHNRLVAIVPKANPARIRGLEDLARRGVKLVVGAEAVPVGRYSREVIRNLGGVRGFPPGYADRVFANVVSQEENVKSVVAKVQLGEADAGFVYRSDVTPQVARYIRIFSKDSGVEHGIGDATEGNREHPSGATSPTLDLDPLVCRCGSGRVDGELGAELVVGYVGVETIDDDLDLDLVQDLSLDRKRLELDGRLPVGSKSRDLSLDVHRLGAVGEGE